jgi:hypothetical protein
MNHFDRCKKLPASAYFDLIKNGGEAGLEAAYYLLTQRLNRALKGIFELYGFGLSDDYKDTIDDFFLYLYEGNGTEGVKPFAMLESIRNKNAFFAWILGTYRRFLLNKAKEEIKRKELLEQASVLAKTDAEHCSEEVLIALLAAAIAYADQRFTLRNRFILYRMLLSFLDHRRAIPQHAMALALNMHPVTYRVCNKRLKDRLSEFILLQEAGETLALDPNHLLMRERIIESFNRLYGLLLEYYEKTLALLPSAPEIQSLRLKFLRSDGRMMHEEYCYGRVSAIDVRHLYDALKSYSTS